MVPHFVETESSRFTFRIAAARAKRAEVIVTIDSDDVVERRRTACIRTADSRMQGERRGAVTPGKLVDERAHTRWI